MREWGRNSQEPLSWIVAIAELVFMAAHHLAFIITLWTLTGQFTLPKTLAGKEMYYTPK